MPRKKTQTRTDNTKISGVLNQLAGSNSTITADSFVSTIQQSLSVTEKIRKTVTGHVGLRMAKFNKYAHEARQAFKLFFPTRYSPTVRGTTYLAAGENITKKQEVIMRDDIVGAKRPKSARGLQLTLLESEALELGVSPGMTSGAISLEKLLRHLDEGFGSLRPAGLPTSDCRRKSEQMADQTLADLESSTESITAPSPPPLQKALEPLNQKSLPTILLLLKWRFNSTN
jgi:hypothetical protein